MAYKALYRSYRPAKFSEVIGQKHVIQTLKNALSENRTSHAYVFSGLRGIGKTTIARILAKAVNCDNLVDGEPCDKCAKCIAINNNETTDIIELDAASNNGVDEIRNILDNVNFLPSFLSKKVYIIDETHMLSTAAFNALLKTLEEPPAHVMFILATTEPHKIPMTILSRCQRFDFKQLTNDEIIEELKIVCEKENIQIDDNALSNIADAAEGGMRDALGILDQASVYSDDKIKGEDINTITGRISDKKIIDLIRALNADDASISINIINELLNNGKEVSRLITCVIQFCRDMLLYKSLNRVPSLKSVYRSEEFKRVANDTESSRLFYYIDVLIDIQNKIRFTNSQKIYLEVGIMKIVNQAATDINVLDRIQNIEYRLEESGVQINDLHGDTGLAQRLNKIESKVSQINEDFVKADILKFEQKINDKLSILQTSSFGGSGESVAGVMDRIDELEIKLNSNRNQEFDKAVENYHNVLNALIEDVESLKNGETFDDDENNDADVIMELIEKVEALEIRVESMSSITAPIINTTPQVVPTIENSQVANIDLSEIENDIEDLRQEIQNSSQSSLLINYGELTERIEALENKLASSDTATPKTDKELEYDDKINNLRDELTLSMHDFKESIDEKIAHVENVSCVNTAPVINDSSDETVSYEQIDELKTNFKILSRAIEYASERLEHLINEKNNQNLAERVTELEKIVKTLNVKVNMFETTGLKDSINPSIAEKLQAFEEKLGELKEVSAPQKDAVISRSIETQEESIPVNVQKAVTVANPVVEEKTEVLNPLAEQHTAVDSNNIQEEKVVLSSDEKPENQQISEEDLTKKIYDAKIVEKILHEFRSPQCRSSINTITEGWKHLDEYVGHQSMPIAKTLMEGHIVACGKDTLLVVMENATLCNYVMEPDTHKEALLILETAFKNKYDFLALPDDTWKEKRLEYHGQYNIGINYPTLTPIKNPALKIKQRNHQPELSKRDEIINKAKAFFGEGFGL